MTSPSQVTRLLSEWRDGDGTALDRLIPLVYDELHARAAAYMARERPGHSLQPTALVHEAFLRLVDQRGLSLENRAHFLAVAARVMRLVLVDHARRHHAAKRGGAAQRITLADDLGWAESADLLVMALHEALRRLEALDPRQSRIIELRFFGGLSVEETATALAISPATVKREFRMARAWLHAELAG